MNQVTLLGVKVCITTAGISLLAETSLGCFFVLGIGASTLHEIVTDLCLTMAFPIFLVGFKSAWAATWGLWLFFVIQWLNVCSNRVPPGFVNPFGWLHGDLLFLSSILVSVATVILHRDDAAPKPLVFPIPSKLVRSQAVLENSNVS